MSSQSTSRGEKTFIPLNRDPRYVRPIYICAVTSNDSIQLDETNTTVKGKIKCMVCNKTLISNKELKVHMTRIHSKPLDRSTLANESITPPDHLNNMKHPLSPLEQAFGRSLHGSIDEKDLWYERWKKVCNLKGKQYNLPNGNTSIHFISLLTKEIEHVTKNEYPSERVIVYISVILQREKLVKRAKDIRILMSQRLTLWEAGEIDSLINDAISSDKELHYTMRRNDGGSETIKVFNRLLLRGKVRDKCPGVRPIGIGESLRRTLSKCVLEITRNRVNFLNYKIFII